MRQSIKKIISTKTFWIILGLGVLFWGFQRYTFWRIDIIYLMFQGPYILPLIFPMIFFYLFAKKRKESYFETTLKLLILWPIWSLFFTGWLMEQFGGGFSINITEFVLIICPILISSVISIIYLFFCNNILNKKGYLSFVSKKKILWRNWFIGLATIIIGSWLCSYIGTYIETKLSCEKPVGYRDFINYIVGSINFFLMWIIPTLPATLKIDSILSKESQL